MKTSVRYSVRCTRSIAKEMVRYESGKIISESDPQCDTIWKGDEVLEEAYTTYNFTIESPTKNTKRWSSFGIVA